MSSPASVSFHNVAELEPSSRGPGGVTLRRFPRSVRDDPTLSPIGREYTSHTSNGCEIRLVTESKIVRVKLTSSTESARVYILRGEFPYRGGFFDLAKDEVTTLELEAPDYSGREARTFSRHRFPPTLWRIYALDVCLTFCGVVPDGSVCRAPLPGEEPERRWLAYGSSITQSGDDYYGFVNMAAQLLGVDALNLGMGGSCFMEESVGDFLASREDWSFATLELGINVLGKMTVEEFAARARRILRKVHGAHPGKPVFAVTTFRSGLDHAVEEDPVWVRANRAQRTALAEIVGEFGSLNVQLLDGLSVFPDLQGFQADLLHPGPVASINAGKRIASLLSTGLGRCAGSP